jgi:uncharacterized protein YjbI with pentapeptide repeats
MMSQIESTRTTLSGEFNDILFDKSELSHSTITGTFNKCSFVRADFRHANITDAIFTNCDLSIIDGCYSTWINCKFIKCNTTYADFSKSEFNNCNFEHTNILSHTTVDICTIMNNCTISFIELLNYNLKTLDSFNKSIRNVIKCSVTNSFIAILNEVKHRLNHKFMIKLLQMVHYEYKLQNQYDKDLVNKAKKRF